MMNKVVSLLIWVFTLSLSAQAQKYKVIMNTDSGSIYMNLYDKTPKHRDNFVKLAKEGFYDGLLFHRVIPQFMIQGGDPESKNAEAGKTLGNGDVGYRVDAEFVEEYFHKKGALAAARDNNPEKASSGCQFYIVTGKAFTAEELEQAEKRAGRKFTDGQKRVYMNEGGSPHLDGNYTVFGEVTKGQAVADKIQNAARDKNNRPNSDVHIKSVKVKKKFLFWYW